MTIETEWRDVDVLVVGSGAAGSQAAQAAAEAGGRVLLISKDPIAASDTKISGGAATVRQSGDDSDSVEALSENIRIAGADLAVKSITDAFAEDSRGAYDRFRAQGLRPGIDTERNGPKPRPLPFGGHTKRRTVGHANRGVAFSHAGWNVIVQGGGEGRIDYLEDAWLLDLVTQPDPARGGAAKRLAGALAYHAGGGRLVAVRAPSVVMASGGLSTLYFPKTDTMRGNTGDGYAAAARAGAELVDMEQLQFLPFCLTAPPSYEGLMSGEPVIASFLGVLRDAKGKMILDGVRLRSRAECAAAIMRAVEAGRGTPNGGAYLDLTANAKGERAGPYFMRFLTETNLPAYTNVRQAHGKKVADCEQPWEVRPAAHYLMGGIRTDAFGSSVGGEGDGDGGLGIAGLFAAGQAMGGVFGADRLGSTSLTEGAVFGARAGAGAVRHARKSTEPITDDAFQETIAGWSNRFGQTGDRRAAPLRSRLQQESWTNIGPVRTEAKSDAMEALIAEWRQQLDTIEIPPHTLWNQDFIEFVELTNMLDVAQATALAARERDGSVGSHVRLDRPDISILAKPYSTVVARSAGGNWRVRRVAREKTPLGTVIAARLQKAKRLMQARMLRWLPRGLRDRALERRYRAVMG